MCFGRRIICSLVSCFSSYLTSRCFCQARLFLASSPMRESLSEKCFLHLAQFGSLWSGELAAASSGDRKAMGAPFALLDTQGRLSLTFLSCPLGELCQSCPKCIPFMPHSIVMGSKCGLQNAFLMTEICI